MMQMRTHTCGELRLSDAGKQVKIVGWMENVRAVSGKEPTLLPFDSIGDFNYLAVRLKAPCLIYGPAGGQCHGSDEFVSVSSLCEVERSIEEFFSKVF